MRVYVASSWRNEHQPAVVEALRKEGHKVYDFRQPTPDNGGFSWSEIDENWREWTPEQYRAALSEAPALRGFQLDMDALALCDACVFVAPAGRSAALELGYAIGRGKMTATLILGPQEPDLMFKASQLVTPSLAELLFWLRRMKTPEPYRLSNIDRSFRTFR